MGGGWGWVMMGGDEVERERADRVLFRGVDIVVVVVVGWASNGDGFISFGRA